MTEEKATLYRGLREVYIDRTTSSYIDGKLGKLYYRGFSIDDLAENCSFEEIIYLVMIGELPTAGELSEFVADLKANMELPEPIIDIIRITKDAHTDQSKSRELFLYRMEIYISLSDRR